VGGTDDTGDSASAEGGGTAVIGGQNYAEMQVMSEMYKALLEDAGYAGQPPAGRARRGR